MAKRAQISLSKSAKKFDAVLFDADCQPQDILTHTAERVTQFTETSGVQFLTQVPCTALALIPGEGVVDHSSLKPSRAAQKMVTLHLPKGSVIGNGVVYTTKDWEGKARWFDTKLITYGILEDGTIWVRATEKSVKARGLLALVQA